MISVVVRTKDREAFLKRALESIENQTFRDVEVVLVNNSLEPLKLRKKTSFPYQILEGKGRFTLSEALNQGILAARGEYIAILDDDDTWDTSYLDRHMAFLQEHQNYRGSVSLTRIVMEELLEGEIQEISRTPFNKTLRTSGVALLFHNRFTTNAFVYEKEAAIALGLYDPSLNELEDWSFNLRFAEAYPVGGMKTYLSNYHKRITQNGGSQSNTQLTNHRKAEWQVRWGYLKEPNHPLWRKALMVIYGLVVQMKILGKTVLKGKGR